jgi:electron transport complex protein RnfD
MVEPEARNNPDDAAEEPQSAPAEPKAGEDEAPAASAEPKTGGEAAPAASAEPKAGGEAAPAVAEKKPKAKKKVPDEAEGPVVGSIVAPSPHLSDTSVTTKGMMIDVLIGLAPVMLASIIVFGWYSVLQVGICLVTALIAESIFSRMAGKPVPIGDFSAVITAVILGLSLPWSVPWYVPVIGTTVAIGIGKTVFGGLGQNIFNPAMVGRAFVMLSFARVMGAGAYLKAGGTLEVITQATPLAAAKEAAGAMTDLPSLWPLFVGIHNGSLGETSALACLIGGIYLCVRRSASWEIPAAVIGSTVVFAGFANLINLTPLSVLHHLFGGALFLGAFFIATDPVTSPLSPKGKLWFGAGIGFFVVLIRIFTGYPEGVMFAVLLMNSAVPLINQWTIPRPVGGPVPQKA